MAAEARRPGAGECWGVFLVALGCYLPLACYLVLSLGRVDWDALAGTAHAYEAVIAARPPNLSLIGFAAPPLPVILQLPIITVAPRLATEGLAANVAASVFGALACVMVLKLLAELRAGTALRWALAAAFGLSPAWLCSVSEGSSVALLGFLFVSCALYFLRWARRGALRDLVLCAVAGACAVLTHFEFAGPVVALCVGFVVVVRRDREGSWSEAEGTLIAFLLPVLYAASFWLLTSWAIMHEPLFPIRAMARTPEAALLLLSEFLLMTGMLSWCRVGARPQRPALTWLPAVVATSLVAGGLWLIGEWNGPRLKLAEPYVFLAPPGPRERTLDELRDVAREVHWRCAGRRVLVDSEVDFAIGLLAGDPYQFVRPADLRQGAKRPGATGTDASYILADRRAPNVGRAEARRLAGAAVLQRRWSRGAWTLYALKPAPRPVRRPRPHP